jgi:eukaryotic-like serine/threonine-protein kinase
VISIGKRACSVCGALLRDNTESCPVCALRGALGNDRISSESSVEPTLSSSQLRFEHYEILTGVDGRPLELGRGAMGVTYKAVDVNLRCPVALKVVSARLIGDESARRRFVREARAAASVRHPNVASVFHLGRSGDSYFYAMEFVDGESLDKRIRRSGRLELSIALSVVTRVAAGLEAIQKQNLVHRDIKPSNIMVGLEGDKIVHTKIIDLGLARGVAVEDDSISGQGTFAGTPQYASPEQFAGIGADIRSDLYSLGVTLWEMLSGKLPFQGSSAELMQQHRHAALPMEKLTGSPQPISALLEVLLEKDPVRRFQSPAGISMVIPAITKAIDTRSRISADKLRAIAGESITQGGEAKKKWRGRVAAFALSRLRWLGWIGLVLLVVVGLLFALDFFFPQPFLHQRPVAANSAEKSIAILPFESLDGNKDDSYFADGIQDEILSKLSKVSQLRVISRTSVMRYGPSERQDIRAIANTLGVTNVVEGTVRRIGQRVRIATELIDASNDQTVWSETYDRDLTDIFAIQNDVAERVALALRGRLSRDEQATLQQKPTQNLAAYDFYLRGWALYQLYRQEDNEKAIDLFKQAMGLDPKFALAYAGLASAYIERVARFHGEESWIDSAINLSRQAITLDPKEVRGYTELANALSYKGSYQEAHELIRKALELDPNDWRANLFASDDLAGTRLYDQRYAYLRKSFAVNPTDTHAPNSMGYLCWIAGDNEWAEKWLQRSIDLETDPERHLMMECERLVLRGDYAAALPDLQKLPEDFFADSWSASNLSLNCYFHVKDWAALLRVSNDFAKYPHNGMALIPVAIALRNLGRELEAKESAERGEVRTRDNLATNEGGPRFWNEWILGCAARFLDRKEEAYEYVRASFAHGDIFSYGLMPDGPSLSIFKPDPEFQAMLAVREKENAELRAKMRAIEASYQ